MVNTNRGRNSSTNWMRRSTRFAVHVRDQWRCVYCRSKLVHGTATLDHLHPSSAGGSHKPTNLVTACRPCNSSRRNKAVEHFVTPTLARLIRQQAKGPINRVAGRRLAAFERGVKAL
jgi:5-methylcytosine-specific restriction endonuclease McrA